MEIRKEDYQKIREAVVEVMTAQLVGRQIMPVLNLGNWVQEAGYDKEKDNQIAAQFVGKGAKFPGDSVQLERLIQAVYKIGKSFKISREDLLSSQKTGNYDLMTMNARKAARKIAELEDSLIFGANTVAGKYGFRTPTYGYTSTQLAGGAWSGDVGLAPYNEIVSAIAKIEALGFTNAANKAIVLHPTNYGQLARVNTYGQTCLELVQKLIPKVLKSSTLPVNTYIVMETGPDIAQLGLAEDVTVEEADYIKLEQAYATNVYERPTTFIFAPDAVVKGSALTS